MDIKEQLGILGISGEIYKRGKEMKLCCPFHDDSHPSFSINLENGIWFCYSRCGGGDWMEFIERIKVDDQYAPLENIDSVPEKPKEPILKSLLDRGFTREMFEKWGIVWDEKIGAMRFPILDMGGQTESNLWRYPEGVTPKYRYEPGFKRSETLYGLWRLDSVLGDVVLVEGPLDAVWVQEAGLSGLAILGSSLSESQAKMISQLKANRVILCFDNDPAGIIATQKATSLLKENGCWVYKVKLPKRWGDIQEVPNDRVSGILARAELSVNGKGMVHFKYRRWSTKREKSNSSGIWRN